jgi:hypothetical protein
VSSWLDGTSALLVRPLWPKGGVRPTSMPVQARLRDALGVVLAQEVDYVKALAAARRDVELQLRSERAQDLAG